MVGSRELQIIANLRDNVSQQMKGLEGNIRNMQPAFRKMAAVGTGAFLGIGAGVAKTVKEAGNAEKISDNFESTFGESAGAINDFIGEFGDKFSFIESEMKSGANAIGFQLNAMGEIGKEEGEKITESLLTASGGLSDFFGEQMSVKQASEAMAKGFGGNRAQLMDMGFNVAVEDIEEMAEKMGMNTDELTKAQEAQAFTRLIMDQTSDSVQGMADNLDSYTARQRAMKKALTETTQALGEAFLPMVTELFEKVTPVIEKIGAWAENNQELFKRIVIVSAAVAGIVAVLGFLGMALIPLIASVKALGTVVGLIASPIGIWIALIAGLVLAIRYLWQNNEAFRDFIIAAWENIKEKVGAAIQFIRTFWDNNGRQILNTAKSIFNGIKNVITTVLNWIVSFWQKHGASIMKYVKDIWNSVYTIFSTVLGKIVDNLKIIFGVIWTVIKFVLNRIKVFWENWGETIMLFVTYIWDSIKLIFKTALNLIKNIFGAFAAVLKGDWSELWNRIKAIGENVWGLITGLFENQIELIKGLMKEAKERTIGAWEKIVDFFKEAMEKIRGFFDPVIERIERFIDLAKRAREFAGDVAGKIGGGIKSGASSAMSLVPGVNDAVITPKGDIVRTHPDDYIMAMKKPGQRGGTNVNVNVYGDVSGEDLIRKVEEGVMNSLRRNSQVAL